MKAKNHTELTLMTFVIALVLAVFFFNLSPKGIEGNLRIAFWILAPIFVFLGSISPDSDVRNKRSMIYYVSWPFAYFMRISEYALAMITGHKIKHRGVLHKPTGIIITSILVGLLLCLICFLIGIHNYYFILYLTLIFMLSQFIHVFQDYLQDRYGFFSVVIYLFTLFIVIFVLLWFYLGSPCPVCTAYF